MALKVFLRKIKIIKMRRYAAKAVKDQEAGKNRRWTGISHGFYSVETDDNSEGSVLAQREQIEGMEVWLFGAFDQQLGCGITKYLQSHLFGKNLGEDKIRRKVKETMRKAYISTRAKIQKEEEANEIGGSTTALVMNGKKFVVAQLGGYRAVVCKDGMAFEIGQKYRKRTISGLLQLKCASSIGGHKALQSSQLVVTAQIVEADTNFIILASDGVWEVMKYQEAVDLVNHIEDAQKAAECLAEEALARMSKATISSIVIRFH